MKPRPDLPATHLTPRQKQVLDLLVKRQTNAQIGESLGISLDGAKWHVSEIISILGVDSREEAADYWRVHNGLPARLRRLAASAFTGTAALRWAVAGGVVVVAVVAGLVWAALRTGDDATPADEGTPSATEPATTTPAPTSTAEPTVTSTATGGTPTAETIGGVPVRPMAIGAATTLPPDTTFFYSVLKPASDGGAITLRRAYLDASGSLRLDDLFATLPERDARVYGYAADFERGEILVARCLEGDCGGYGFPQGESTNVVFRSLDGGLSWEEYGSLPRDGYFTGGVLTGQGAVLTVSPDEQNIEFMLFPSGEQVTPPVDRRVYPRFVPGIGLTWMDENSRFFDAMGNLIWESPSPGYGQLVQRSGGETLVSWLVPVPSGQGTAASYVGILDAAGNLTSVYKFDGGGFSVYGWVGRTNSGEPVLVGNVLSGAPDHTDPALIVLGATGETHELPNLLAPTDSPGLFAAVQAAVSGPVLRVTGAGHCLNVRVEPDAAAESLGCYRDDVLLRDLGRTQDAGGMTWHAVATPDGREGWASGTYLE